VSIEISARLEKNWYREQQGSARSGAASMTAAEETTGFASTLFEGTVPAGLLCPFCKKVPRVAMELPCGHLCCGPCSQTEACSADQVKFRKADLRASSFAALQIAALTMRCPNRGCKATFALGKEGVRCKEHLDSCEHQLLKCSQCAADIARAEIKSHVEYKCPQRPAECKSCDVKLRACETALCVECCV
jgi:hypothetical protein